MYKIGNIPEALPVCIGIDVDLCYQPLNDDPRSCMICLQVLQAE